MQIQPYLDFPGTCAEAMRFYQAALGGRDLQMQTMGEGPMAAHTPPDRHHRIMHANMAVGDSLLMASDVPDDGNAPAGRVTVNIATTDIAESERVFAAMSEGGTVEMPLQQARIAEGNGTRMPS